MAVGCRREHDGHGAGAEGKRPGARQRADHAVLRGGRNVAVVGEAQLAVGAQEAEAGQSLLRLDGGGEVVLQVLLLER